MGKVSNIIEQATAFIKNYYDDFGPTFAVEKLKERS